MKDLTKAEEEIMKILWLLGPSFTKDIHEEVCKTKDVAFNTVSTIIRILEKKGAVSHKKFGRSYQYFATFEQAEFKRNTFSKFMNSYFGGSKKQFVSFFLEESEMDIEDMNDLLKSMKDEN